MGVKSRTFEIATLNGSSAPSSSKFARVKLTDAENKRLRNMIQKATSLQEISRLEKELIEGRLPAGMQHDLDAMEE